MIKPTITAQHHQQTTHPDTDAHGNPINTWTTTIIKLIAIAPATTDEPKTKGHTRITETLTVYLPPETILNPQDRLTINNTTYEVQGLTKIWKHPNGKHPGNTATLKQVKG